MACCWPIGTVVLMVSHCFPRSAGGSSGRGDSTEADNRPAQLRRAATVRHMNTGCFSKLAFKIKQPTPLYADQLAIIYNVANMSSYKIIIKICQKTKKNLLTFIGSPCLFLSNVYGQE